MRWSPMTGWATLTTPIGGRRDHRFSKPLSITATVERLFDAKFVLTSGHLGRNLAVDMGSSAVLRGGDVRIVVTSKDPDAAKRALAFLASPSTIEAKKRHGMDPA